MSQDIQGGLNYALLKRHYDCDDYIHLFPWINPTTGLPGILNGIPFTVVEDYYVVGTLAYMNDNNVVNAERGWTLFAHGRPTAPTFLVPTLIAANQIWPLAVPAFEAKDILFWADQNCWIRFEGPTRTRHFIPANTYMRFHRRCLMFYVGAVAVNGTLRAWIEG